MKVLVMTILTLGMSLAFAKGNGPCEQIKHACESAGFVKNQAKLGTGLWVDCIDPIMRGTSQPKKAVKALPTVDASLVSACKAKRPNFGQGKKK
jgi:hypothetical protein